MLSRQKLQTFILKDKHQLSVQDVLVQAQLSALRRAEMMGWTDVELVYSSVIPNMKGEYAHYSFDIWGLGESMIEPVNNQVSATTKFDKKGQAAKDADL